MSYIFSWLSSSIILFVTLDFFQLSQNEYPFMDYYNFLFTLWTFLDNQDPEDEILVLLNQFDFFMNVNIFHFYRTPFI